MRLWRRENSSCAEKRFLRKEVYRGHWDAFGRFLFPFLRCFFIFAEPPCRTGDAVKFQTVIWQSGVCSFWQSPSGRDGWFRMEPDVRRRFCFCFHCFSFT